MHRSPGTTVISYWQAVPFLSNKNYGNQRTVILLLVQFSQLVYFYQKFLWKVFRTHMSKPFELSLYLYIWVSFLILSLLILFSIFRNNLISIALIQDYCLFVNVYNSLCCMQLVVWPLCPLSQFLSILVSFFLLNMFSSSYWIYSHPILSLVPLPTFLFSFIICIWNYHNFCFFHIYYFHKFFDNCKIIL